MEMNIQQDENRFELEGDADHREYNVQDVNKHQPALC